MRGGGRGAGAWANDSTKLWGAMSAWGLQESGVGPSDLSVCCATTLEGERGAEPGGLERLSLRPVVPKHGDEEWGTAGLPEMISDSPRGQNLPTL